MSMCDWIDLEGTTADSVDGLTTILEASLERLKEGREEWSAFNSSPLDRRSVL